MFSMPNALNRRAIIVFMLAVVCVGPLLAQRPGQNTRSGGEKKQASGDQSLEDVMEELSLLDAQVREARQQQTDERVAAARTIAALEAEKKQLTSARDENELRLQLIVGRERVVGGIVGVKPAWQETEEMMEKLIKDVTELRRVLDRSLPSKPGQTPAPDGKPETRTNGNKRKDKP